VLRFVTSMHRVGACCHHHENQRGRGSCVEMSARNPRAWREDFGFLDDERPLGSIARGTRGARPRRGLGPGAGRAGHCPGCSR
jgi:hypothetical protein